jgi:hypothetical protein
MREKKYFGFLMPGVKTPGYDVAPLQGARKEKPINCMK